MTKTNRTADAKNKSGNSGYAAIVLGAGRGERSRLSVNKVLARFENGECVLEKSVAVFKNDPDCRQIVVVCAAGEKERFEALFKGKDVDIVVGGNSRQQSVFNALKEIREDRVLIHDGARPFVKKELLERLKNALQQGSAAIPVLEVSDTLVHIDEKGRLFPAGARSSYRAVQTPQAFDAALIKSCHQKAAKENWQATDDASLIFHYEAGSVLAVEGDFSNIKITTAQDVKRCKLQDDTFYGVSS